jgi:hypothetical protein
LIASGSGEGRVAFLDDRHVAAGSKLLVERVIDVLEGEGPSVARNAPLSRMLSRVGDGQDAVAALLVSPALADSLRRAAPAVLTVVSRARVAAIGAAVRNGRLRMGAALQMSSAESTRTLDRAVRRNLDAHRRNPIVALTVLGEALSQLHLSAERDELVATLSLTESQLDELLQLYDQFLAGPRGRPGAGGQPGLRPDPDDDGDAIEIEPEPEPPAARDAGRR